MVPPSVPGQGGAGRGRARGRSCMAGGLKNAFLLYWGAISARTGSPKIGAHRLSPRSRSQAPGSGLAGKGGPYRRSAPKHWEVVACR